jgi:carbon monoxide dehydrogenase subunit G
MRIRNTFTVGQPLAAVWAQFLDVPAVARCLPGAELTEDRGDGRYAGKMAVKLGPITAGFECEATVTTDAATWTGIIDGAGIDRRGGSRGRARVAYALAANGAGTDVTIDSDITLSGPAAQFGRTGLIEEVSRRLVAEFARCLEAQSAAATPEDAASVHAADVQGVPLLLSSAWKALRSRDREP